MIARVVHPAVGVFLILALSASASAATRAIVTGSATYRERLALTPGAVFEAELLDVSRAGARGEVIARVRKVNPGQVPIAFTIAYDPRRIDVDGTYAVRATIRESGRLRFAGDRVTLLLTYGPGRRVTILMRPAREGGGDGEEASGLGNVRWRPVQIGDEVVTIAGRQSEPWIELDPHSKRVTGSGGCNRITGGYEADGATLSFGRLISTQMACLSMATEAAFLRALRETRRYRIRGRVLELLDDRGRLLVRLEERTLR